MVSSSMEAETDEEQYHVKLYTVMTQIIGGPAQVCLYDVVFVDYYFEATLMVMYRCICVH